MIVSVVTAAIGVAAVAVSARHFVWIGARRPPADSGLEAALRSGDGERLGAALGEAFAPVEPRELARALVEGGGSAAAVAELNEKLGDVERELRDAVGVPRSAARIALFAGAFGAIAELLPTVGAVAPAYGPAIAAAGIGLVAAAASAELGRRTRARVGDVRSEWDRLAASLGRRLGAALREPDPAVSARRSRRR